MKGWRLVLLGLGLCVSFGCNDSRGPGASCFDSGECSSGVCTDTVYGRFCMKTCEATVVRCEGEDEACIEAEPIPGAGGSGGAGGSAGSGGGAAGSGGSGGGGGTGLFVCLPGRLEAPDYMAVPIDGICTYSLDCATGLICVCPTGATCDPDDEESDSPRCSAICDPTLVNSCPFDLRCVDLGNGRGFCDPSTAP